MCGKSIWLRALPVVETRQVWANQYTVFHSHAMTTGTYFMERSIERLCVSVYVCLYICDWQAGQRYTSYILSVNFYCRWELGWLKALRCVFHMCALQKELYRSQRPEDAPRSPNLSIERLVYLLLWTDLPYEIPKSRTVLYCFPPYFHLHKERSVGWFI